METVPDETDVRNGLLDDESFELFRLSSVSCLSVCESFEASDVDRTLDMIEEDEEATDLAGENSEVGEADETDEDEEE